MLRFLGKWEGGGGEREREREKKILQRKGKKPSSPAFVGPGEEQDTSCR